MDASGVQAVIATVFSKERRFDSLHAVYSHRVYGDPATQARDEWIAFERSRYKSDSGRSSRNYEYQLPYDTHDWQTKPVADRQSRYLLWHESPDRWREETINLDKAKSFFVANGVHRWQFDPPHVSLYTSHNSGANRLYPFCAPLVYPHLMGADFEAEFSIIGDQVFLNRNAVEIRAEVISWDHPPVSFLFQEGAQAYSLVADRETGILLKFSALSNEKEFFSLVAESVDLDLQIADGTFSFQLPQ